MRFAPLAKQTSSTTGTGAYELLPPAPGFQSFVAAIGDGGTAMFVARDAAKSEVFIGTVVQGSPDTLARDNVVQSTDADAAINWAAGVRDVYLIGLPGMRGFVSVTNTATLAVADLGAFIRLAHADAKTLSLPPLTDCYDGFAVQLENAGAGTWTLDADGSDQIDGAGTATLLAGESCWLICRGTSWSVAGRISAPPPAALPRGYLSGLGLANNGTDAANDIDIATGTCRDGSDAANMVLASALTKRLDAAWAAGTNQGGLDTGSKANSTWYYIWLIRRSDTGLVDALFSISATAPTMPTNYDQKRRLGVVRTDGSGNLLAFTQRGDRFYWTTPSVDVSWVSAASRTLAAVKSPPFICQALLRYIISTSATGLFVIGSPSETDVAPSATATPLALGGEGSIGIRYAGQIEVLTDATSQVAMRASGAMGTLYIATLGWIDRRGRDD